MPRIPVRVEPYASPQRKLRHFKNKRDQILRALGKASYINGSQFAILWVNTKGETEQYASALFQAKLDSWFNSTVMTEAREMVVSNSSTQSNQDLSQISEFDMDEEQHGDDDDLLDQDETVSEAMWDLRAIASQKPKQQSRNDPRTSITTNSNDATKHRNLAPGLRRTYSMPNPLHIRAQSVNDVTSMKAPKVLSKRPPTLDLKSVHLEHKVSYPQGPPNSSNPEYRALEIGDKSEVTAFLETRFRLLQQLVCKIVAKAWIKVIEPKKQTRFPYNKGEECKPPWWPASVRHKEPDHLMKPERINLLMTMLRCTIVPTNRLELATAEVAAFIPPDKINLLKEIYRVGREEERFRQNEIPADTRVFVAVTASLNTSLDDINSPTPAAVQTTDNLTPRSAASVHDTNMSMQRSHSQQTPQFDNPDPFTEPGNMQQGYAMMPPQNFYYANADGPYTNQSNTAAMSASQAALAAHTFQQAQEHMFIGQQAQVRQQNTQSITAPGQQVQYAPQATWASSMEHTWPHTPSTTGGFHQQTGLEHHLQEIAPHMNSVPLEPPSLYHSSVPMLETPAKQTQRAQQHDSSNLRSSPYLPTPLRPEGNYSASRGQGIHFSDYLNSPRTGGAAPMHGDDHGQGLNPDFR